jgi:hypothetical protein
MRRINFIIPLSLYVQAYPHKNKNKNLYIWVKIEKKVTLLYFFGQIT